MMILKALTAPVLIGLLALATTGCCQQEKQRILDLEAQYNDLSARNKDLQQQLADADSQVMACNTQLSQKDRELAALRDQMQQPVTPPPAPAAASGWVPVPGGDMVTVATDILFRAGSASLTPQGQARLNEIVADIKRSYSGLPVRVYGHTDTDPIRKTKNLWQDNLDLSANRAMAVTRFLVSKGVDAKRIETVAMGEHHPVGPNTGAAKARNRRVDIVVVKQ